MSEGYDPASFWDGRFERYGHTGEADALLYAYDQPQRRRAIERAMARSGIVPGDGMRVLDIGCGTGDMIAALLRYGRLEITGIDISEKALAYARQRFAGRPEVAFQSVGVEEMAFPSGAFDLVLAINVLQHVISEEGLGRAIANMVRVTRPGGHILAMDFSPPRVRERCPAPFVIVRSRDEYIAAFAAAGAGLVGEFGLPRIGVRLCRNLYGGAARLARRLLRRGRATSGAAGSAPGSAGAPMAAGRPRRASWDRRVKAVLLALARPFDMLLAPFPPQWTDMRILILQKPAG